MNARQPERLDVLRRRYRTHARNCSSNTISSSSRRQHRVPKWRLVSQGDQDRSRSQGSQDADCGMAGQVLRSSGSTAADPAAKSTRPLRARTHRRRRMGWSVGRRKLALNKVARFLLLPGLVEGSAQLSIYVNSKQWGALPRLTRKRSRRVAKPMCTLLAEYTTPRIPRPCAGWLQPARNCGRSRIR